MAKEIEQVRAIAERVTRSHGLEVWDIVSRRESSGQVIRVFIDRPGPAATPEESVSIEDCAEVSREIGAILDVEDPLPSAYTLEVSSPGLDRPLRQASDYGRFAGRRAKLVMRQAVDGQMFIKGRLSGIEKDDDRGEHIVMIVSDDGRSHRVPIGVITRANLEVEF